MSVLSGARVVVINKDRASLHLLKENDQEENYSITCYVQGCVCVCVCEVFVGIESLDSNNTRLKIFRKNYNNTEHIWPFSSCHCSLYDPVQLFTWYSNVIRSYK
jgi:hypothetical protein